MSHHRPPPQNHGKRSLRRVYLHTLGWVLTVWFAAACLVFATLALVGTAASVAEQLVIAIASAAIAGAAMLPGFAPLPHTIESGSTAWWQRLTLCIFAGMAIRLTGTVALFLSCRYHMATPTEMIAGLTIGWYVLLTSSEVFVLARELPTPAKGPKFPETSLG